MPQVHLDTIPIWDAYKMDTECPVCALEDNCERQFLDVALGGAMMEPDTRIATNEKGFCPRHFAQLYDAQNRLSLALMTHTHLKDVMDSTQRQSDALLRALEAEKKKNPLSRAASGVAKSSPFHKQMAALADHVQFRTDSCYICDRIQKSMDRYIETICYLYKKDESFRSTFTESKGVCQRHYAALLRGALEHMSGSMQMQFVEDLLALQKRNLERVEHDLEWFTLKFDYRNQDKPWGNSRDAVERSINRLQGRVIPKDNEKG